MNPTPMTKIEQLDNQMAMINSPDALRRLRGYQSMRGQLPMIAKEEGGILDIAEQEEVSPEESQVAQQGAEMGATQALEVAQQVPPEMQEQYAGDVAELKEAARGLASMGRMGDTELVHMTADELSGLHSMGQLTYNPITGLPEAFSLKGFTKIFSPIRALAKPIKNVMKSKAFKTLAPIVLGIAAPYALGASGLGLFSTAGTLGFGAATALGTGLGSLLAGQKPSDALKSALISGATAGVMKGIGNKMAGKTFMGADKAVTSGSLVKEGTKTGLRTFADGEKVLGGGFQGSRYGANLLDPGVASYTPNVAERAQLSALPSDAAKETAAGLMESQRVAPIVKEPSMWDKFTDKDMWKNIGTQMKEDFIIPKEGGGLDYLKTAGKFGKALLPTQLGEMTADASAMERDMLTEEEFNLNPSYRQAFPNYEAYTKNYYQNLQPTQYADEASALERYVAAGGGPPMKTAAGGEFSGMVPGQGGGMQDNVFMPIKEGNKQVGTLAVSPTEYVVDSYTMAALGGGNPDEGAKIMDKTVEQIREKAYGTTEQPNEIDGLRSLVPLTRSVA